MSLELLENPKAKHRLGFDVEALMWTLLRIVRVYDKGEDNTSITGHPLDQWFSKCYPLPVLAAIKESYLENVTGFTNEHCGTLEKEMQSLAHEWRTMRHDQFIERNEAENGSLLSEAVYGMPGFNRIETWVKDGSGTRQESIAHAEATALDIRLVAIISSS